MTTRAVLRHAVEADRRPVERRASLPVERRTSQPRLRAFRTPVRGHAFAAPPDGGSAPEAGLRARLAREPRNPADPFAVAVWVDDGSAQPWRIGYLDRGVAARVAPRLDEGLAVEVCVEGWVPEPEGRWHRPLVRLVPDRTAAEEAPAGVPLWQRPPGVSIRRVSTG